MEILSNLYKLHQIIQYHLNWHSKPKLETNYRNIFDFHKSYKLPTIKCIDKMVHFNVCHKWVVQQRNRVPFNSIVFSLSNCERPNRILRAKDLYLRYVSILGLHCDVTRAEFARTWVFHLHYAFYIHGLMMTLSFKIFSYMFIECKSTI